MLNKSKKIIFSIIFIILLGISALLIHNYQQPKDPKNGTYSYTLNQNIKLKVNNNHFEFIGDDSFIDYFGRTGLFMEYEYSKDNDEQYTIKNLDDGPHMQFESPNKIILSYGAHYSTPYIFIKE